MKINLVLTGKSLAAIGLALIAVVLAVAGTMAHGSGAGPVDSAAIMQSIIEETDHVTPVELARWIIEKRQDYQLIDLRQPWQFDDYHIPTAVNVPLSQFFQDSNLKQLDRSKKIVVYGLGAGHAAETQLVLQHQRLQRLLRAGRHLGLVGPGRDTRQPSVRLGRSCRIPASEATAGVFLWR